MGSDGQIIIETSLDSKKFNNELNKLKSSAQSKASGIAKSFDDIGGKLTKNITKPAGIAAGAIAGIVLAKGWARMTEIDNAKAKLRAVGNTAADVKAIMENATEAVKGTAYGLDEAATASASAVAAGVKTGKELTQYLTNTADAASVAGTSLSEMGNILNKIQTGGKAYTGDLNQLADRGLPVYQWLGDAAGKSAEEMQKAARKGQVSAQMVQDAIQNNIAGAAKEIGSTTITGAISNIGASIGRIGANFLGSADDAESFSGMVLPMLNNFMDKLGGVEDKAKEYGATFATVIKGTIGYFKQGNSAISQTSGTAKKVLTTLKPLLSTIKMVGKAFGSLETETKVKLVAGLVLIGPAMKIASKGMKGLKKTSESLTASYAKAKAAQTGNIATSIKESAAEAKATATTHAHAQAILKANAAKRAGVISTNAERVAMVNSEMATRRNTMAINAKTAAARVSATATGVATVAQRGLNVAMAAMGGPAGLAITGAMAFAAVIASFPADFGKTNTALDQNAIAVDKVASKVDRLTKSYVENKKSRTDTYNDAVAEAGAMEILGGKIEELAGKENRSAEEKAKLKAYTEQLNEAAGETVVKYDEQTDTLSKTTEEIWNYINASREQLLAEAARQQAGEAAKDLIKNEKAKEDAIKAQTKAQEEYNAAKSKVDNLTAGQASTAVGAQARKDLEQASSTLDKANSKVTECTNNVKKSNDEIDSWMGKAADHMSMDKITVELNKVAKSAGKAGKGVPDAIAAGIKSGKIKPANAIKEARALIQFNALPKASSKAGKDTINKLASSIASGKTKPSDALKEANAALRKEADKAPKDVGKGAAKIPDETAKAINRNAKKVKAASGNMVKNSKPTNVAATYKVIGTQATAGAASGITSSPFAAAVRAMVRAGLAAGKDEAQIHSPSKKFRDIIGLNIAKGVGVGITAGTKYAKTAMKTLIASVGKSVDNVSGNFSAIGNKLASGTSSKLGAAQSRATKSLEKSLKRNLNSVKKVDTKEEKALQKKINKASGSKKKALQKELKALKNKHKKEQKSVATSNSKVLKQYEKAWAKQTKKINKQAKRIQKISDKYQEKYDAKIALRDSMKSNLMKVDLFERGSGSLSGLQELNAGSLKGSLKKNIKDLDNYRMQIDKVAKKVPNDLLQDILKMSVPDANNYMKKLLNMSSADFNSYVKDWQSEQAKIKATEDKYLNTFKVNDLKKDVADLKEYNTAMQALTKKAGGGTKIPDSLKEEIASLSAEDGIAYLNALNSMTKAEFDEYIALWKEKDKLAGDIANNMVKDDVAKIKSDYQSEMDKEMATLETQMKNLGKNVMAGFRKGLKSDKKKLSKTMEDICDAVIKATKKKYKIKSPSKVMSKIFSQVIQGGEVGMTKEAPKLIKEADKTNDAFIDRFKAANIDPGLTVARMQRTVANEMAMRPAAVTKLIHQFEDPNQGNRIIQLTIDEGDIYLDGEKVGKKVAKTVDIELGKTVVVKQR